MMRPVLFWPFIQNFHYPKNGNSPQRTQRKNKTLAYVPGHPQGEEACCANHLNFFVFSVSSVVQLLFQDYPKSFSRNRNKNKGP